MVANQVKYEEMGSGSKGVRCEEMGSGSKGVRCEEMGNGSRCVRCEEMGSGSRCVRCEEMGSGSSHVRCKKMSCNSSKMRCGQVLSVTLIGDVFLCRSLLKRRVLQLLFCVYIDTRFYLCACGGGHCPTEARQPQGSALDAKMLHSPTLLTALPNQELCQNFLHCLQ